jgi:hypothetical protein
VSREGEAPAEAACSARHAMLPSRGSAYPSSSARTAWSSTRPKAAPPLKSVRSGPAFA